MKINGKQVIGESFAYDGCHKIYVIESETDKEEALSYGYDIYPIEGIEEAYRSSCGLEFISNWGLDKTYVEQFEEAIFENE